MPHVETVHCNQEEEEGHRTQVEDPRDEWTALHLREGREVKDYTHTINIC